VDSRAAKRVAVGPAGVKRFGGKVDGTAGRDGIQVAGVAEPSPVVLVPTMPENPLSWGRGLGTRFYPLNAVPEARRLAVYELELERVLLEMEVCVDEARKDRPSTEVHDG
jgi:hypothetical protein